MVWCQRFSLRDSRYTGYSWNPKRSRYDRECTYRGPGFCFDHFLFRGALWAVSFLTGDGRLWCEGQSFQLSDHSALLTFVDVSTEHERVYGPGARRRRDAVARVRDQAYLREVAVHREEILNRIEEAAAEKSEED